MTPPERRRSPDIETIHAHYDRARPVFEVLATVDEYPTIGLNDFVGWYIKRDHDDVEAIEAGYPQRGRVARLDQDYDEIIDRLERTLYAVTTYKDPDAFRRWEPCRYDDAEATTVWQDEPPTPDHADLRAVPAWGDIDLADDIKPERGTLDEKTRTLVEKTLEAYVKEFAELYGTRDAVYALDSVGGAYIFGAPEATLPIADHFADDADALGRVFDAFLDRSNAWLRDAEARVNARIDGAVEVIQPDWVNNKNRQYKPPLALHKDHDAVVTPLGLDGISYDMTSFTAVDDDLINRATSWAEAFTAVDHTDCIETLVATLWAEEYDEYESWQAALEAWVNAEREREREERRRRERALKQREERLKEIGDALEGLPITPFKQDVYDAVETIDITEIAQYHASDAYDTDPAQPRSQFNPSWRHSESGQSCFVNEANNTFGDSKVNAGGGPAKLMALATGIISDATEDLSGETYWEAVDALRDAGYEIPVWIPETRSERVDGGTYDQMPFWAVKKAAVVLGVCPRDAFVEREGEDGTYEGFPGYETYNETLAAIEEAGLEHGRDPVTPDSGTSRGETQSQTTAAGETTDKGDSLSHVHLKEKNQLLEAKINELTETIQEQAETIEQLERKNDSLRAQLKEARRDRNHPDEGAESEEQPACCERQGSHPAEQTEPDDTDRVSALSRMKHFINL